MEVRNILLGCPNLTIFWLYRDRSNVQSWNMAQSLLWIIILWAVICTEILGRELKYQLTSLLFKNRDKYVPLNCHCLAAQGVTYCHMFPSRAHAPHFSSQTADFRSVLVFWGHYSINVSSTSKSLLSQSVKRTRISLFAEAGLSHGIRIRAVGRYYSIHLDGVTQSIFV